MYKHIVTHYDSSNVPYAEMVYKAMSAKEKRAIYGGEKPDTTLYNKDNFKAMPSCRMYSDIVFDNDKNPIAFLDVWYAGKNVDIHESLGDIIIGVIPKYQGKGVATETVKHLLRWFNRQTDINTLTWGATTDNEASINLAIKCNFKYRKFNKKKQMLLFDYKKR